MFSKLWESRKSRKPRYEVDSDDIGIDNLGSNWIDSKPDRFQPLRKYPTVLIEPPRCYGFEAVRDLIEIALMPYAASLELESKTVTCSELFPSQQEACDTARRLEVLFKNTQTYVKVHVTEIAKIDPPVHFRFQGWQRFDFKIELWKVR